MLQTWKNESFHEMKINPELCNFKAGRRRELYTGSCCVRMAGNQKCSAPSLGLKLNYASFALCSFFRSNTFAWNAMNLHRNSPWRLSDMEGKLNEWQLLWSCSLSWVPRKSLGSSWAWLCLSLLSPACRDSLGTEGWVTSLPSSHCPAWSFLLCKPLACPSGPMPLLWEQVAPLATFQVLWLWVCLFSRICCLV